jgi:hypothetical protein
MIVEARVKRTNLTKDKARIDVFNPRFRFKPLISIGIKHEGKKVKFFTSWNDLSTHKCLTANGSKVAKNKTGGALIRGTLFCCGDSCDCCDGENTVFIYMPEQLIK